LSFSQDSTKMMTEPYWQWNLKYWER
jgi:hypothetical protein